MKRLVAIGILLSMVFVQLSVQAGNRLYDPSSRITHEYYRQEAERSRKQSEEETKRGCKTIMVVGSILTGFIVSLMNKKRKKRKDAREAEECANIQA